MTQENFLILVIFYATAHAMEFLSSTYIDEFIAVTLFQLVAMMSPGPDFIIVVQNSLLYSRRVAVCTAIGIATGVSCHIMAAVFGIGFIITQSTWMLITIKILAGGYLSYISYCSFKAGAKASDVDIKTAVPTQQISAFEGFRRGYFTNLLNPKCILFFLTLFTVVLDPDTPGPIMVAYCIMIYSTTLIWFVILAVCFSKEIVQNVFKNYAHWINRATGLLFLVIALKIIIDLINEF